jgi:hypothetical protein
MVIFGQYTKYLTHSKNEIGNFLTLGNFVTVGNFVTWEL